MGDHAAAVREGRWTACADWCFWDHPLLELDGMTMGIIGFGRIGQRVGRIARALGMRVLAHSRTETEEGRAIADYVPLDTLLAEADVVSLHCPLFPETAGIINRESIAKMKDGAILINNSRGGLIVELAAGMDVVSAEPIRADNPLLHAKNCILTPHISWAAGQSRVRILDQTVENVKAFLAGKPVNVVN